MSRSESNKSNSLHFSNQRSSTQRHMTSAATVALYLLILLAAVEGFASLAFPPRSSTASSGRSLQNIPTSNIFNSKQNGETNSSPSRRPTEEASEPICRIVSRADSKLPTSSSQLPESMFKEPYFFEKLDAHYNAQAYKRAKRLPYLKTTRLPSDKLELENNNDEGQNEEEEDEELIQFVRNSLTDAGFQLLTRRDLDLCDSLNVGYLLRLSLSPDISDLDPGIAQQFYPEKLHGGMLDEQEDDDILFGGRCLVFWRGYSEEVTTGRLIIPKIDYLQTSLVRRSATWVNKGLDEVEKKLTSKADRQSQKFQSKLQDFKTSVVPSSLSSFKKQKEDDDNQEANDNLTSAASSKSKGGVNLGRYGGSNLRFIGSADPDDALDPFMVCEVEVENDDDIDDLMGVEYKMNAKSNHRDYSCEYDDSMTNNLGQLAIPRIHLLERVSINNLVNVFTNYGRRTLVRALSEESKLVEPTYEEVVVIWKPLVKEKPKLYPPRFVSDLAEILDMDGFEKPPKKKKVSVGNLEIRNFQGVPMSNIQAVLPKTKLVFRPADALLFDTISFVTFALVAGSIRLDSPKLDLLALISVSLWIIRTVVRYSNKLARYDLLVKNFLTSKISHRNEGALKYLSSEAGSQRAIRASLVLSWIYDRFSKSSESAAAGVDSTYDQDENSILHKSSIRNSCIDEVNEMINMVTDVQIDVDRALDDLEELNLVTFSPVTQELVHVSNTTSSVDNVKQAWSDLLLERNIKPRKHGSSVSNGKGNNATTGNLLSNLEENRKPLKMALEKARKKGYSKVKELLEDEETRKKLETTLRTAKEKGYTKVKEILQEKNLDISKKDLEQALNSAQTKGYTKVKEILREIKKL